MTDIEKELNKSSDENPMIYGKTEITPLGVERSKIEVREDRRFFLNFCETKYFTASLNINRKENLYSSEHITIPLNFLSIEQAQHVRGGIDPLQKVCLEFLNFVVKVFTPIYPPPNKLSKSRTQKIKGYRWKTPIPLSIPPKEVITWNWKRA